MPCELTRLSKLAHDLEFRKEAAGADVFLTSGQVLGKKVCFLGLAQVPRRSLWHSQATATKRRHGAAPAWRAPPRRAHRDAWMLLQAGPSRPRFPTRVMQSGRSWLRLLRGAEQPPHILGKSAKLAAAPRGHEPPTTQSSRPQSEPGPRHHPEIEPTPPVDPWPPTCYRGLRHRQVGQYSLRDLVMGGRAPHTDVAGVARAP